MRLSAFVLLILTACASEPVTGPPGPAGAPGERGEQGPIGPQGPTGLQGGSTVKSGTRLKARVARSEDGASQFLGWWDSELGVECTRDSPGSSLVPRCLPVAPLPVWSGSRFADSDCSLPVVRLDEPLTFCSTLSGAVATNDMLRTYYSTGARVGRLFEFVNGSCVESSESAEADWRACGDLEEVPLDSFAAMPEAHED